MKILGAKYSCVVGSQLEALGVLGSKTWRKQTPIFFEKKCGSVFFNFLIQALLRPQITGGQRKLGSSLIWGAQRPREVYIWIFLNLLITVIRNLTRVLLKTCCLKRKIRRVPPLERKPAEFLKACQKVLEWIPVDFYLLLDNKSI